MPIAKIKMTSDGNGTWTAEIRTPGHVKPNLIGRDKFSNAVVHALRWCTENGFAAVLDEED